MAFEDSCCAGCNGCDCDGNVYSTVIIGGQNWFSENLYTTTDNSGNPISNMCYDNNSENCEEYGNLYTYEVVIDDDICPIGWHIPTDIDWKVLENILGMSEQDQNDLGWRTSGGIGAKMKDDGTWNGSNTSGFTGLPGGRYNEDQNSYGSMNLEGFFWSPSIDTVMNFYRVLHTNDNGVFRGSEVINDDAMSVRCIQD